MDACRPGPAARSTTAGRSRAVLLLLALSALPSHAWAWWDAAWQARIRLDIDNSGQTETLTDFPILVVLDGGRIDYGRTLNAGQDVRFVDADDSTVLDHEIEVWDEAGTSYVWVRVPQVDGASSSDHIYLYFDNPGAPDGQNVTGVWSNGYAAVWHMNYNTSGARPVLDSTANGKDASPSSPVNAASAVPGLIGGAIQFDGANDYLRFSSNASDVLGINGPEITVEAWANVQGSTGAFQTMVGRQFGNSSTDSYALYLVNNAVDRLGFSTSVNSGENVRTANGAVVANDWTYLVGRRDTTNLNVLARRPVGVSQSQQAVSGNLTSDNNDVTIGAQENGSSSNPSEWFQGILDEVRISTVYRSDDWIEAQHLSMRDSLLTYGAAVDAALVLSKRAFALDGTPIPSGTTVPSGMPFFYLLYINNHLGAQSDVSVQDVLDPAFAYVAGTIQTDNSVAACGAASCTPAEEAAIFAAVRGRPVATDAVDADTASYRAGVATVDAGNQHVANAQLDLAGGRVWALVFQATMP